MTQDPAFPFPLRTGRVHEATGPGAAGFAAIACAAARGPVMWITGPWSDGALNPLGFAAFADPARLLMVRAPDPAAALATAEEALRDGAAPIVVIEIARPLTLTAGRRRQLAAGTGRATGLCLIAAGMGSNAAETRWHAAPRFDPEAGDSTPMRWELIKNKQGTLGAWNVRWDHAAHRLDVVSPAGERPGTSGAAG